MRSVRGTARLACAVGGAFLLAACGGASPSGAGASPTASKAASSYYDLHAAKRSQQLAAAAKQEGHLTWYTSLSGPVIKGLIAGFEKQNPGVKVDFYRATATTLVTKMVQSAQAGRVGADVLELTTDGVLDLRQHNLIAPYYSPFTAHLPAQFRTPAKGGEVWAASERVSYLSFGYNKRLVPSADVPHKLQDLLNPALKGKMGIGGASASSVYWVGAVLHAMGRSAGTQFLQRLGKGWVKYMPESGASLMALVAQGQLPAAVTIFQDHEEIQAGKGAPVAWVPIAPVVANLGNLVVVAKSPHPAAAMLFVDYVLGPSGQAVLHANHYGSPSQAPSFQFWVPQSGMDATQWNSTYKGWQKIFDQSFPH